MWPQESMHALNVPFQARYSQKARGPHKANEEHSL